MTECIRTRPYWVTLVSVLPPALTSALVLSFSAASTATPVFFGPTPYLSTADIPAGFYAGGVPTALEDFEDETLDFGITVSGGVLTRDSGFLDVDSVDADDGVIDGSGLAGESWFVAPGSAGLTFTFSAPVTAAGIVWTDGADSIPTTFEAFGPGMVSLGTFGPFLVGDGSFLGETAEDRFFGVKDLDGIIAIRLSTTSPGTGLEVDHVQFGVPEPSTALLFGLGLLSLGLKRYLRNTSA